VFQKGYIPNWTVKIFAIVDRYPAHPVRYGLADLTGEHIRDKFYEQEIQKETKTDDDVYEVENVLKTRKRGGKVEYFVKWRGYPDKFNSWVTDVIQS
jgi:hypothetical protein